MVDLRVRMMVSSRRSWAGPACAAVLAVLLPITSAGAGQAAVPGDPDPSAGAVSSWGYDRDGELGHGTHGDYGVTPGPVDGLTDVTAVATAYDTVYALRADGTVSSWGVNDNHELGAGPGDDQGPLFRSTPAPVVDLDHVVAIGAGADSGYAITADGTLHSWGRDLQSGTEAGTPVPHAVSGLPPVKAVTGGGSAVYALAVDGSVWAWGEGHYGQLGDGGSDDSTVPVRVAALSGVVAIASGQSTGYALTSDGVVHQWGLVYGQQTTSDVPAVVPGLTRTTAIAGGSRTGYALAADGTVHSWGLGLNGACGDGSVTGCSSSPSTVVGLSGVVGIAGSLFGGEAVTSDGRVHTWGVYTLGNGTQGMATTPVTAVNLPRVARVASGPISATAFAIAGTPPAGPAPLPPAAPPFDVGALFALLLVLLALFLPH